MKNIFKNRVFHYSSIGIKYIAFSLLFLSINSGCKKFIDNNLPTTSINAKNAYSSDATAVAVLNGLYAGISGTNITTTGPLNSLSLYAGLSADEFTLFSGANNAGYTAYYTNSLSASASFGTQFWLTQYTNIFICNSAIEGLTSSSTLTPAVKRQLLGEAKFMRAYFYFYLVNLYGDVPLQLSSDYTVNAVMGRTPKADVYKQIKADLVEAETLLSATYIDASLIISSTDRVRPTKWAAAALLARAYLYTNDYVNAEAEASTVINNAVQFRLTALNSTFLKNSTETILQWQPISGAANTFDALLFILPASGPSTSFPVYLSNSLLSSFEAGDQRRVVGNWVNSVTPAGGTTTYFYPYKYKTNTAVTSTANMSDYIMVLRLAEQYLIRAEARAQQSNVSGAQSDLNTVRTRAGLPNTTASTQAALLTAVLHENQVEFFSELGHRWFDLKRTGTIDAVMSIATPAKGGSTVTWNTFQQLYPLSLTDIQRNQNLTQNPGY